MVRQCRTGHEFLRDRCRVRGRCARSTHAHINAHTDAHAHACTKTRGGAYANNRGSAGRDLEAGRQSQSTTDFNGEQLAHGLSLPFPGPHSHSWCDSRAPMEARPHRQGRQQSLASNKEMTGKFTERWTDSSPPKSPEAKSCNFRPDMLYCLHEQSTYYI